MRSTRLAVAGIGRASQAMIEHLRAGDVVVVWKLDRLSRSLKDLLHILDRIEAAGAGFRSLTKAIDTTTPAGRMMMQMVGAFAEFERAMIRERVMAGLSAAAPRPLQRCALQEDAGQTPARAGGDGKSGDQGWQALPRDRRLSQTLYRHVAPEGLKLLGRATP